MRSDIGTKGSRAGGVSAAMRVQATLSHDVPPGLQRGSSLPAVKQRVGARIPPR
jgi:hypothetical protein